ncbi:MAG: hypothetical protein DRQ64_10415 [Gammaproteobacteria bacterium]|nr:MAG: hypothetical protein DRQ64_10415 [Gammaproteobacteria bacterium]
MSNNHVNPDVAANGSRLVRALVGMSVSDVVVSNKNFAMRLGRLVDLSDSISISKVHTRPSAESFQQEASSPESLQAEFLRVRNGIVASIIKSYGADTGFGRIKFPRPDMEAPADSGSGYPPYGKFYAAHQRDMEFKISQLRLQVRDVAEGASAELAQLAALDEVLADTLAVHSRKMFARVPGFLEKRFDQLLNSYQRAHADPQAGGSTWPELLEGFGCEIRELLLAEVEARLLPTQGLIEALNAGIDK